MEPARLRVLCLEDSQADAEILLEILQQEWPELETVHVVDRRGFVEALAEGLFDLIVADNQLPGFSGMAALALAREKAPLVPFLFYSGTMGEEFAIETLRRGATDYVLKDRRSRLVPAVRRALHEAEEGRERREAEAALARALEELRSLNTGLEERVRCRTAELEAANREMEAFAHTVSHDLRSPLRAIGGYAQVLAEDYAAVLDAEGRRLVGGVIGEAARMGRLIDDILAFSRIGRQPVEQTEVDMEALAREAFQRSAAQEPGRRLRLALGPLPSVRADVGMVSQVWDNLLGNAVKYTRTREVGLIEVTGESRESENLYSVRDNGVGFDPAQVGRLFGVFVRLHSLREFEGTGVGLSVVRRIVERHGGRVWAEGRPGEGATFWFALPA